MAIRIQNSEQLKEHLMELENEGVFKLKITYWITELGHEIVITALELMLKEEIQEWSKVLAEKLINYYKNEDKINKEFSGLSFIKLSGEILSSDQILRNAIDDQKDMIETLINLSKKLRDECPGELETELIDEHLRVEARFVGFTQGNIDKATGDWDLAQLGDEDKMKTEAEILELLGLRVN